MMIRTLDTLTHTQLSTVTGGTAVHEVAETAARGVKVIRDLGRDGGEIAGYVGRVVHRWGKHM